MEGQTGLEPALNPLRCYSLEGSSDTIPLKMAEVVRFELTGHHWRPLSFQDSAIDRSATLP
jgi:hypothetical protein